ncbi:Sterol 24-C-methyltransferase 1 [Colletotrichum chlorophyti]|uniref:Sterol 24-C-methyltransferase 1 n=1 Tax=Colletotrichum chlorophyti TaxID=708187 RepID=A0A1Q8S4M3_9PEZI|nr:Sterol 24-C-methyltransferase 1 [Colletotrichum chlorophyti]
MITQMPSSAKANNISSNSPRISETSDDTSVSTLKPATQSSWKKQRVTRTGSNVNHTSIPKRSKTFWKSFKYLLNLTPAQVDNFMESYVIYGLDWADEKQMVTALGQDYRQKIGDCLQSYYGVLNHLCALGDVEKMYIPPLMDKRASILENQMLYEESIARDIELKPGDRVLDLGCGRGRVAAHMATVTGAQVTGLNIDPNQVAQAREFNEKMGLQNSFTTQDMNELPLPFENSMFDAFYQIQALSLCKDLPKLFAELRRVLKPDAKISLLDWVSLPAYDPSNSEHAELMRRTKPLIGAVGTPTPEGFEKALAEAGFTVLRSDNASIDGLQAPLIDKADVYFRSLRQVILGLVKVRLLPPHFKTLINRLCLDGQAFVQMDTLRLVTTSYRIIAQKT